MEGSRRKRVTILQSIDTARARAGDRVTEFTLFQASSRQAILYTGQFKGVETVEINEAALWTTAFAHGKSRGARQNIAGKKVTSRSD